MNQSTDLSRLRLDFHRLRQAYREGLRPETVVAEVYRRIAKDDSTTVWKEVVPEREAREAAMQLPSGELDTLPLYGIPFAVKDNFHVQGLSTRAGCAIYEHAPAITASSVRLAIEAGAILIGKNTMDEFATGLVGIRSTPHPVNPFDSRYITGGSSSGSAVAVACDYVSFSLGTDSGGSGRIPAALNNIVGLKSTPGLIKNDGLVYAHRSFDCVSIFAYSCADAGEVFRVLKQPPELVSGISAGSKTTVPQASSGLKVGVPTESQLNFLTMRTVLRNSRRLSRPCEP